jgi:hypothetical protein
VLPGEIERRDKLGLTSTWGSEERKACVEFFRSSTDESATDSDVEEKLRSILEKELREMSER